ncbi:hypothetical protein GCM10009021_26480 [Halarchaeum nitratireducens]|uniref:Uncharacterized protein n=1 Tax=Halarchaeum nitratireducens TaxID=489913 RepID=A0A830GD72_9EURY|nr:hypothetical protein GCM10009021_26480 [Halarchaeum nitratireducens]
MRVVVGRAELGSIAGLARDADGLALGGRNRLRGVETGTIGVVGVDSPLSDWTLVVSNPSSLWGTNTRERRRDTDHDHENSESPTESGSRIRE